MAAGATGPDTRQVGLEWSRLHKSRKRGSNELKDPRHANCHSLECPHDMAIDPETAIDMDDSVMERLRKGSATTRRHDSSPRRGRAPLRACEACPCHPPRPWICRDCDRETAAGTLSTSTIRALPGNACVSVPLERRDRLQLHFESAVLSRIPTAGSLAALSGATQADCLRVDMPPRERDAWPSHGCPEAWERDQPDLHT